MSCFLYFIPLEKEQPLNNELLDNVGLRDIFDSVEQCVLTLIPGRQCPLGLGYLLADKQAFGADRTLSIGAKESWRKRGRAYVRLYDDSPVDPDSLARPTVLPGLLTILGDGHPWKVPVARVMDSPNKFTNILPAHMVIDDDTGEWTEGKVLGKYARLEELAAKWWDDWHPAASEAIAEGKTSWVTPVDKPYDRATEVLAYNYRIGRIEASLLVLFVNCDNASDIMGILIDAGTACQFMLEDYAKKKSAIADGSHSSVGVAV